LRRLNLRQEAASEFREAAAAARKAGEHGFAGSALSSLGGALRDLGDYSGAATAYLQAAGLLWEAGEEAEADQALEDLASMLKKLGHVAPTDLVRATEGYPAASVTMIDLSVALRWRGRLNEAMSLCEQAVNEARAGGDLLAEGAAADQLSATLLALKRHDEATECARGAVTIAQQAASRRQEVTAWNRLGSCLRETGHWEESAAAIGTAVEIATDLDRPYALAGSVAGLARTLAAAHRRDDAIEAWARTARLYHGISRELAAQAQYALSWCLLEDRRYDEAIEAALGAHRIFIARDEYWRSGLARGVAWRATWLRRWGRLVRRPRRDRETRPSEGSISP
jgi:tetratricopeptide (TPR) repeat protein